jgi:class 3 adenylate cyclase/tetratricopeptide (TPR) repeat protein
MKCPGCQFDNREGAKFCIECGKKLEIDCSNCNHLNPPASKFCEECGAKLNLHPDEAPQELSFDDKIAKIQKYLPKGVTEKILAQKDRIEGERKQVTVMFCDLEGFTRLSDRLGPEDVYRIMDQVYESLIHRVHDYGGTVNEMTGDGVLALFGAPIALEEAPQRALRSAYSIHREMVKLSDRLKQEKEFMPPLRMRIGIHTGPVVVGTLGNDLRVDFKAVGDTVNLASRVENLAEPGATYVTEETFKNTEGFFRFEARGTHDIKGKKAPVKLFRVIAPSSRMTRFDVSAERGLTPFIGRDRELELLLDGYHETKSGRGQACSIVAEAGVGKSRLLYEFRKEITNENVTILEGKCLSYSKNVVYHPLIDILKSNFDIRDDDHDTVIREKVAGGLKLLGVNEAVTLPYILELFHVEDSGLDENITSPEAKKNGIIEAVKRISLKGSEIRPLIVAIEDLHWVDKSSEEYFKELLNSISGSSIFLIFTYRPEFVHTWGARSYHSQINLNRLSNRESIAMVKSILGTENIEIELEELILEKTEGVPFFIEEFIKSLKELKIIERKDGKYFLEKDVQELSIPSKIHDVIMARVDTMPEGAKEVLQTGSVIEREFNYELLHKLMGISDQELLSCLSVLKDSELIYERGIYPQSSYIFKHALTQEVVYGSILAQKRKKRHNEIGLAIEALSAKNAREKCGILAEHFFKAENHKKAEEYLRLAAKEARKKSAFLDAISYAEKGIECAEKVADSESNNRKLVDARTLLAGYHMSLNHHVKAKDAVAPIVELAQRMAYRKRLPTIYVVLGTYYLLVEENFPKGVQFLNDALEIAKATKNYFSVWSVYWFTALGCYYENEVENAIECLKRGMRLSVKANHPGPEIFLQSYIITWYLSWQGKIEQALNESSECLRIAEETGDLYYQTPASICCGVSSYVKGDFEKAEAYLLQALDFSERTGHYTNWMTACEHIFEVYISKRAYRKAASYFERMIAMLEPMNYRPSEIGLYRVGLAMAKVLDADRNIDIDELMAYRRNIKSSRMRNKCTRYLCDILLNIDAQQNRVENWIRRLIEMDKQNSFRFFLAQDHALYAEFYKRHGKRPKAEAHLGKVIDIFTECGASGWAAIYEEKFANLNAH